MNRMFNNFSYFGFILITISNIITKNQREGCNNDFVLNNSIIPIFEMFILIHLCTFKSCKKIFINETGAFSCKFCFHSTFFNFKLRSPCVVTRYFSPMLGRNRSRYIFLTTMKSFNTDNYSSQFRTTVKR